MFTQITKLDNLPEEDIIIMDMKISSSWLNGLVRL
jgi:hypothetical protein